MPDTRLYTREAALAQGTELKTALAAAKLRLCGSAIVITEFTTKVELEAAEAAFDGYVPGGYPLATWLGPLLDPAGGAVVTSPMVNVIYGPAEDPPVTANITAWWIEDASGDVRLVGQYDPTRPLVTVGQGWQFISQVVVCRNPTIVVS